MVDTKQLIEQARKYYRTAADICDARNYYNSYKLGAFWAGENNRLMAGLIENSCDAVDAVHGAQRTFMFSVNIVDPVKEKAVDWLLHEQRSRGLDLFSMSLDVQESEFSLPDNNVICDGRRVTPNFLRALTSVTTILNHLVPPDQKLNVLELGAGLGHVAQVFKTLHKAGSCYIIVDLPETLFFSYQFLSLNFPDAKMLFVTDDARLSASAAEDYNFIFVPTIFVDAVLGIEFDLFINTASLGEMHNSVIRYWMDFIQNRAKVRCLYTLNRYLNVISPNEHPWRLEENECSVLYDAQWRIVRWEQEPAFTRCPFVDPLIARYVEILAERRHNDMPLKQRVAESRRLLDEVCREDWVRLARSEIHHEMSMLRNVFAPNMSMGGALFKLWESIRLHPNVDNLLLMLRYLERRIGRGNWEFEETDYYERLFLEHVTDLENKPEYTDYVQAIRTRRRYRRENPSLGVTLAGCDQWQAKENAVPTLIQGDFHKYNIVLYRDRVLGLPISLGPVDYDDKSLLARYIDEGTILSGYSTFEIRSRILQSLVDTRIGGQSSSTRPKVSVILLDWSCRESAHGIDYLNNQNVPRNSYELIWVEYYSRRWEEIARRNDTAAAAGKPPVIDQWLVLDMPRETYYHKHLMYNVGIAYARGEIVVICDSDAVFAPDFIQTIIDAFEKGPNIVLHMDQVRNFERKYHPFNYPDIDEIMAGAGNLAEGKPFGLVDIDDPLHSHNYGACFAARRDDIIAIGGADEHIDYLGHCCGPYDMTYRLVNAGKREFWHPTKWTYHVWHPGMAGDNNFIGPHDGKMMSATALAARRKGRILPLTENPVIRKMRLTGRHEPLTVSLDYFIRETFADEHGRAWVVDFTKTHTTRLPGGGKDVVVHSFSRVISLRYRLINMKQKAKQVVRKAGRRLWDCLPSRSSIIRLLLFLPLLVFLIIKTVIIMLLRLPLMIYVGINRLFGRRGEITLLGDCKKILAAVGIKKGSAVYRFLKILCKPIFIIRDWLRREQHA